MGTNIFFPTNYFVIFVLKLANKDRKKEGGEIELVIDFIVVVIPLQGRMSKPTIALLANSTIIVNNITNYFHYFPSFVSNTAMQYYGSVRLTSNLVEHQ